MDLYILKGLKEQKTTDLSMPPRRLKAMLLVVGNVSRILRTRLRL